MQLANPLGNLYRRFIRGPATNVLQNPHFSVHRSELFEISENYVRIGDADSFRLAPPMGSEPLPHEFEEIQGVVNIPESFVCEVSHVQLVGPDLIAIAPRNRYIIEEMVAKPAMVTDALARTIYAGTLPIRRNSAAEFDRPVASLAGIQSRAYFHWFADYLPRVRGIERYAEETGTYPDVLFPSNAPDWLLESINYVGIPENRLIEWTGGRSTANPIVIPSVPRRVDPTQVVYAPRELRWLGQRIKSAVNTDATGDNRILITRRGASTRRIVNEEEVIDTLQPLGFAPVNLTNLSLEEQVELFASASAVVAPHGAGLINMIYSNDVRILEIFGDFVTPLYYCIAGGLGFSYRYERCEETQPTANSPGVSVPGNDLVINVDRLEKIAREWLI